MRVIHNKTADTFTENLTDTLTEILAETIQNDKAKWFRIDFILLRDFSFFQDITKFGLMCMSVIYQANSLLLKTDLKQMSFFKWLEPFNSNQSLAETILSVLILLSL